MIPHTHGESYGETCFAVSLFRDCFASVSQERNRFFPIGKPNSAKCFAVSLFPRFWEDI